MQTIGATPTRKGRRLAPTGRLKGSAYSVRSPQHQFAASVRGSSRMREAISSSSATSQERYAWAFTSSGVILMRCEVLRQKVRIANIRGAVQWSNPPWSLQRRSAVRCEESVLINPMFNGS
jgi:hypothetical protein